MERCETCRFVRALNSGDQTQYLCRRFPPQPRPYLDKAGWGGMKVEQLWPPVASVDWCGEYQPKANQSDRLPSDRPVWRG